MDVFHNTRQQIHFRGRTTNIRVNGEPHYSSIVVVNLKASWVVQPNLANDIIPFFSKNQWLKTTKLL